MLLGVAFVVPALAAGPWDGTYVYEQGLGKGAGGISLFVTHTLTIDGSLCRLTAEGYQTDSHIRCKATTDGDKLEVAFASFREGAMLNRFGVREYTACSRAGRWPLSRCAIVTSSCRLARHID